MGSYIFVFRGPQHDEGRGWVWLGAPKSPTSHKAYAVAQGYGAQVVGQASNFFPGSPQLRLAVWGIAQDIGII